MVESFFELLQKYGIEPVYFITILYTIGLVFVKRKNGNWSEFDKRQKRLILLIFSGALILIGISIVQFFDL